MSVAYQRVGYHFPIPVLSVRFRRLGESIATKAYQAIVDTGADMTMASAEILVNLQRRMCKKQRWSALGVIDMLSSSIWSIWTLTVKSFRVSSWRVMRQPTKLFLAVIY